METKHTPGPWEIIREQDYDGTGETTFVTQIGPFHIEFHDDLNKGMPDRIEADISLFAAAPPLFAALQGLFNGGYFIASASDAEDDTRLKKDAIAAIAKALGTA